MSRIPFTRIHLAGTELDYVRAAIESRQLAGDGAFTRRCERWLEAQAGCSRALLTHSGTAALEMAAILSGVGPGDEVIMPSFTFSSTANAFVLRGATPVFVDIEPRTLNLDAELAAAAVTSRTKAIVPVHYAGIACNMDAISHIASENNLMVIEDAAQALLSTYRGRPLGTLGAMAALSFHQTKNVAAGEGGALLVNDASLVARAEIVREKGTNRSQFYRGEVDKYTWVDLGSSFLPGELIAAFLLSQLENAEAITAARRVVWDAYHAALEPLEKRGLLIRPLIPDEARGNAHIYFVILPSPEARTRAIDGLRARGISAVFHYVPLHSSPAGMRYGRTAGQLPVTDRVSERLLRLPVWPGLSKDDIAVVAEVLEEGSIAG
ncbi:MAG: dTDP-4-amino-4,6-dideoxygalactose transaminase [Thermoanaerobaculia bacterium]